MGLDSTKSESMSNFQKVAKFYMCRCNKINSVLIF